MTLLLALLAPAWGAPVPGGGSAKSDCLIEADFGTVATTTKGQRTTIQCTDCDQTCDAGPATADGMCVVQFKLCPKQSGRSGCDSTRTLRAAKLKGISGTVDTASSECQDVSATVKTKRNGKKKGTKVFRAQVKTASGRPKLTDTDLYKITCNPSPGTCVTTTTTTTTSTTTLIFDFTTSAPDLSGCESGATYDAADGGATIKTLHCGGLSIGGGPSTVAEGATPENATNRFIVSGCTGSVCTLAPTTAPGPGFECTSTGCSFGPPLPIVNGGTSTCVVNTFSAPGAGTIDMATGNGTTTVPLASGVFLTGNATAPCPRCVAGQCERGPNGPNGDCTANGVPHACCTGNQAGSGTGDCAPDPCTTTNSFGTSNDCAPDGTDLGALDIDLTPLGTTTAVKSDSNGIFCPGQDASTNPGPQSKAGCFGSAACKRIENNGIPAGPITVNGPAVPTRLASVFCIPESSTALGQLINLAAGLPGPGAISLPGTVSIQR